MAQLQQAKQEAEAEHNWGQRFTHEKLGERTGLSLHTISRILMRKEGVDKQSLECLVRTFGLELSETMPHLSRRLQNWQLDRGTRSMTGGRL